MGRNYVDMSGDNNPNYKTGYAIKGKRSGFYNSWQNMKARCLNPKNPKYKRYGERGIEICDEWMGIAGFASWSLSNGWEEGFSLDRIDNDGNYCPENCEWISVSDNSRKKSTTKISIDNAKEIRRRVSEGESEHDLAKEYGVVHGTVWFIVNNFTHVAEGECTRKLNARSTSTILSNPLKYKG